MNLNGISYDWGRGDLRLSFAIGTDYPALQAAATEMCLRAHPVPDVDRSTWDRLKASLAAARDDHAKATADAALARKAIEAALLADLPTDEADAALGAAEAHLDKVRDRVLTLEKLVKDAAADYQRRYDEADARGKADHKANLQRRMTELNAEIESVLRPRLAEAMALLDGIGW